MYNTIPGLDFASGRLEQTVERFDLGRVKYRGGGFQP